MSLHLSSQPVCSPVFVHSQEDVTQRPVGGHIVEQPDREPGEGRILGSSAQIIFLELEELLHQLGEAAGGWRIRCNVLD